MSEMDEVGKWKAKNENIESRQKGKTKNDGNVDFLDVWKSCPMKSERMLLCHSKARKKGESIFSGLNRNKNSCLDCYGTKTKGENSH